MVFILVLKIYQKDKSTKLKTKQKLNSPNRQTEKILFPYDQSIKIFFSFMFNVDTSMICFDI